MRVLEATAEASDRLVTALEKKQEDKRKEEERRLEETNETKEKEINEFNENGKNEVKGKHWTT